MINYNNFPTGKGGILYKPEFFYKTKDLIFNDEIYLNTCDKQDDIWFYIVRILNNINCYIGNTKWCIEDLPSIGLSYNFNSKNNNNTLSFKNTINKLKELDYKVELFYDKDLIWCVININYSPSFGASGADAITQIIKLIHYDLSGISNNINNLLKNKGYSV